MEFEQVLGQERAKGLVLAAIEHNRLGHAYLFSGPDGVGKRMLAEEMAKGLFCRGAKRKPCGECNDCKLMAGANHPDFFEIGPMGAGNEISIIKQIRPMIDWMNVRPVQADRRIAVIREAERMSEESANALLKTLEEPPSYGLLILTTSRVRSLLPTIRSRCQDIRFEALSPEQVRRILKSKPGLDEGLIEAAIPFCRGSAWRALRLIETGCVEMRGKVMRRIMDLPGGNCFELAAEIVGWLSEAPGKLEPKRERLRELLHLLEDAYGEVVKARMSAERRMNGNDETAGESQPGAPATALAGKPVPHRSEIAETRAGRMPFSAVWRIQQHVWEARRKTDANASLEMIVHDLLGFIAEVQGAA